jgi:hypothetical protein
MKKADTEKLTWVSLPASARSSSGPLKTDFTGGKTTFKQIARKGGQAVYEAVTEGKAAYAVISIVTDGNAEWFDLYGFLTRNKAAALGAIDEAKL